jgi:hypothetical protein
MLKRSTHRAIPTVPAILTALLVLTLLPPTLATARPLRTEQAARPAAERAEAGLGLIAQLRGLLSVLWAETGSGLDPNGTGTTSSGTTGDTGSGLDPDGRP